MNTNDEVKFVYLQSGQTPTTPDAGTVYFNPTTKDISVGDVSFQTLPSASTSDNGKVLSVVEGAWAKNEIPPNSVVIEMDGIVDYHKANLTNTNYTFGDLKNYIDAGVNIYLKTYSNANKTVPYYFIYVGGWDLSNSDKISVNFLNFSSDYKHVTAYSAFNQAYTDTLVLKCDLYTENVLFTKDAFNGIISNRFMAKTIDPWNINGDPNIIGSEYEILGDNITTGLRQCFLFESYGGQGDLYNYHFTVRKIRNWAYLMNFNKDSTYLTINNVGIAYEIVGDDFFLYIDKKRLMNVEKWDVYATGGEGIYYIMPDTFNISQLKWSNISFRSSSFRPNMSGWGDLATHIFYDMRATSFINTNSITQLNSQYGLVEIIDDMSNAGSNSSRVTLKFSGDPNDSTTGKYHNAFVKALLDGDTISLSYNTEFTCEKEV